MAKRVTVLRLSGEWDTNLSKLHKSREYEYRFSLKRQITLVFVSIFALTIGLCLLVNNVFLEKFYTHNKEKALFSVYSSMKSACENGTFSSEDYDLYLQKTTGTHNVSIVIISSGFEPLKIYSTEPSDSILQELSNTLFGKMKGGHVIKTTEDYIVFQKKDERMGLDYLEMGGMLPNEAFFLMRTPLESIKVNAEIANKFLLYLGLGGILLSAVVIYFFTKKISKPILELADISERMSEMDFEAKYDGKDKTEIAVLGNSINKMSENLKNTIDELKAANVELQKDNELKTQIDNMRKEFISNVSHELKTPIALIQGYAEGLKEGVNESDERDYYCDVIMDESQKMNSMVKQLLLLNQLESGSDILNKEYFDICSLVHNYMQSAELLAKQNNIVLNIDVPNEPIEIFADEFKIEEVLTNYYTNAIHYCESDLEKRIDVSVKKEENRIILSVFNTGKEIPNEAFPHLWEKFYKVDKARTREYGGSGVGLSIVKAIIDAHNGEYGAYNKDNGVVFYVAIHLPEGDV